MRDTAAWPAGTLSGLTVMNDHEVNLTKALSGFSPEALTLGPMGRQVSLNMTIGTCVLINCM